VWTCLDVPEMRGADCRIGCRVFTDLQDNYQAGGGWVIV
jgi:hypothetical protein